MNLSQSLKCDGVQIPAQKNQLYLKERFFFFFKDRFCLCNNIIKTTDFTSKLLFSNILFLWGGSRISWGCVIFLLLLGKVFLKNINSVHKSWEFQNEILSTSFGVSDSLTFAYIIVLLMSVTFFIYVTMCDIGMHISAMNKYKLSEFVN